MADVSDMVEFEFGNSPQMRFPVGAGGPMLKIMRFFYPIPIHLLHMFTGPVSLYSFFHILRQTRGENNIFKKQWDWLRTKKECDRCGGFEHEICPVCESRGSLPFDSKLAQTTWTNFHNPELLEKADEEGKEIADMIGGDAGKLIGRARGLRSQGPEVNAELEYSMGKFKVLGQKPGTLPCKTCSGEGVIKCLGCHGNASKVDNWPDIDYYMQGPGRAMEQWMMANPDGLPVTETEREFLENDPYTAKWWTLRKHLIEGHKEYMTPREKLEAEEEYDAVWFNEQLRKSITEKRPGWRERLEIMKSEDPVWVYNSWALSPPGAAEGDESEGPKNDELTLLENLQESPEVRNLRYMVLGPYTKLFEMFGVDPTTMAETRPVPEHKKDLRKVTDKFMELYGDEADLWLAQRRNTKNFGLEEGNQFVQTVVYDLPEQLKKIKSKQRGDELAACMKHPIVVEQYAEYIAAKQMGNSEAADAIARQMMNSVRELDLAQSTAREDQRRQQREAGLALLDAFKKDDVDAGWAAAEAAGELLPEIAKQDPEILEIERSVAEIEEVRDAARERLNALPEPRSFFSRANEDWTAAWNEARRYESLHTIRAAGLIRKIDAIRRSTGLFPVAREKAQARLVEFEEDRVRDAEARRLGRQLSRDQFRSMLIERWRGRVLQQDALDKAYEALGPNADDVIFKMSVKELRDEHLEQAHRQAGRLGEKEDLYVALKRIETYELAESCGWDDIKKLTYPTAQYALTDEKALNDAKKKARQEAAAARRKKIAKRGQIGTRLAETFEPITNFAGKIVRLGEGIIGLDEKKARDKKAASKKNAKPDARQEAKHQKELERARIADEKRAKKEEREALRVEKIRASNESLDEKFDNMIAFVDDNLFGRVERFFSMERRKHASSAERTAAENARIAREAERAAKARARKAGQVPAVEAAAKRNIERADAHRKRAVAKFDAWKTEFLADPKNRDSPAAADELEARRKIVVLEEEYFEKVKAREERSVQRAKDDEHLEVDHQLALQAEIVRDQLWREDLTIPDHVDVRRFLVEGTVRPDVLEAMFDKQPIPSRGTPADRILEQETRAYDESVRKRIRANEEAAAKLRREELRAADAPMIQTRAELSEELDGARRTFLSQAGRPALEVGSDDETPLWKQQWNTLGQDNWVAKTRTALQLAVNPLEKRPVAFAALSSSMMRFGRPSGP